MSIRIAILTNKQLYLQGFYDALRSRALDAEIVASVTIETQAESTIAETIPVYDQEDGGLPSWLESHTPDWLVLIDWQTALDPEILNHFAYRAINIEITPALEGASQAEKQAIMDEQEPLVAGLKACQQNLSQEMHMIAYLLNGEPNAKGIVIGSDSALIYKRDRLETLSMRIQQSVIKTAVSALRRLTEGDA